MPPTMDDAMIRVDGLHAGYGGEPVLHDVSLSVEPGGFVGICGPNACGKSTLVKVLTGVLASERGEVTVGGLDVNEAAPRELAKVAGVVPQSTDIPFPFTGEEIVAMGRFPHLGRFAAPGQTDREAIALALAETDTGKLSQRLVTQVSGGERQRLILARALAQQAPLVILDEATASMDVHRKIDTFDLLRQKNSGGMTVVAVMHDLNLAAQYCERLVFMKAGRIYADGPPDAVFTRETLEAVYETPVEVFTPESTGRPHALFLSRGNGADA